jgi:hypothetical protein
MRLKAASGRKVAITKALDDDNPDAEGSDEISTASIPVCAPGKSRARRRITEIG